MTRPNNVGKLRCLGISFPILRLYRYIPKLRFCPTILRSVISQNSYNISLNLFCSSRKSCKLGYVTDGLEQNSDSTCPFTCHSFYDVSSAEVRKKIDCVSETRNASVNAYLRHAYFILCRMSGRKGRKTFAVKAANFGKV